jgi:MoaA/NifB/PqqE/SkfB family radical SAM enzyme
MFIKKRLGEFRASTRFFFNVHLDGLKETHDKAVEREGVFDAAVEGIKAAKEAGFLVCTNTTIYKETDLAEIDALFGYLARLGVDGFLMARPTATRPSTAPIPTARRDLHDARRHPREVPRGGEAVHEAPHDVVSHLPGVPERSARAVVYGVGQSDAERQAGRARAI